MRNLDIREIFYSFFKKKKHYKALSSPLIPAKDPTLLFTNAGMNQFKNVFLQEEKREYKRAVSIQKCMRVSGKHNDFNEVGKTEFHHTFFEMMGNFSFGDYFKEKAIEYAWELLIQYYQFDPEMLSITVFEDDDEAYRIWEEKIGIPPDRIFRCGEKDNFWQMGDTGPCGPCSEVHFDRGEKFGEKNISKNTHRYIEIWNLVFMEYHREKNGKLNPLPAPSIDTGMGMERLTALLQGVYSNYQTDLFLPIIKFVSELANISEDDPNHQVDFKVIADHVRALTFLISDGVLPSNTGRGYVLRRILRRAAKHGKSLGFSSSFLYKTSSKIIDVMKGFYPELEFNKNFISEVILSEEERFNRTLSNGLKKFEELISQALENRKKIIPGTELFKLSDTYGFPLDFAVDLANEQDLEIDYKGFKERLESQREKSRIGLSEKQTASISLKNLKKYNTNFLGYDSLEGESTLLAIYVDNKEAPSIKKGQAGILVFDQTPFYAESGGQVGETGFGRSGVIELKVINTQKVHTGAFLHFVSIEEGHLKSGDTIRLVVDKKRRQNSAVHHSSTHLLHSALREVLGLHVKQAGSHVGPEKLRFDFTHFKALTNEELNKVENIVNQKIRENIRLEKQTVKFEQAIEEGAIAIFEEKYSDMVRLVSIGDFSKELCGGIHIRSTGEIGIFKILTESSISSGIRRIEAVAGKMGFEYIKQSLAVFEDIKDYFKQKQDDIFDFLVNIDGKFKEKEKELKKIKVEKNQINPNEIIDESIKINDVPAVINHIKNYDKKQLGSLSDEIKNRIKGVSVLSTNINGNSAIVVSVYHELTKKLNANIIIKEIVKMINGNGGGREDFAQAGGDRIADFVDFKKKITEIIKKHLQ